jgi:tRNA (cmo5U34)-methyltransferase
MDEKQVQEHFAKQAADYEALMTRIIPGYLEQNTVIKSLLPKEDKEYSVLDLGCGDGILSETVWEALPRSRFVGYDITPEMLDAYSARLSKKTKGFETVRGDFGKDPIGKGYDIVLAGLSLHHLHPERRRSFYKTLFASLEKGGVLLCRDIIIDENEKVRTYQYELWKDSMRSKAEDPEFWYSKHRAKDHPITPSDIFAWLSKAGFVDIGCHYRIYNFMVTSAKKTKEN